MKNCSKAPSFTLARLELFFIFLFENYCLNNTPDNCSAVVMSLYVRSFTFMPC